MNHVKQIQEARVDLEATYGKKDSQTFIDEAQQLELDAREPLAESFREDYEIGTELDGRFFVNYYGLCEGCGYKVEFKQEKQFPLKGTDND